ncbi:MAG: hypothetical protein KGJ78_00175 [Alphaproteobacteria bacterium]|nr:hypothetical protein [Alphaproteobacteria bacterium]
MAIGTCRFKGRAKIFFRLLGHGKAQAQSIIKRASREAFARFTWFSPAGKFFRPSQAG